MNSKTYQLGVFVINAKRERPESVDGQAKDETPTRLDDACSDVVATLCVIESSGDGRVVVRTPGGKRYSTSCGDHNLRHATWWERTRFQQAYRELLGWVA